MAFLPPGVPALLNVVNFPFSVLGQAKAIASLFNDPPIWGVFNDKNESIFSDQGCVDFELHDESQVTDAPQEEGAFISYNEVRLPKVVRISFAVTGSNQNRSHMFIDMAGVRQTNPDGTLALYSVVTPEVMYKNMRVVAQDYRRSPDEGLSLIVAEIVLREVRVNIAVKAKKTGDTNGADKMSNGQMQGTVVPTAQASTWASELYPSRAL